MMQKIQRFMMGRNGTDELSFALLGIYLLLAIVGIFFEWIYLLQLVLMIYLFWRMFSRNVAARRRENEKFLSFWRPIAGWFRKKRDQLRDKEHRYYACPACKATLRLPKGKGKICITCPRCRKEFIKKT